MRLEARVIKGYMFLIITCIYVFFVYSYIVIRVIDEGGIISIACRIVIFFNRWGARTVRATAAATAVPGGGGNVINDELLKYKEKTKMRENR